GLEQHRRLVVSDVLTPKSAGIIGTRRSAALAERLVVAFGTGARRPGRRTGPGRGAGGERGRGEDQQAQEGEHSHYLPPQSPVLSSIGRTRGEVSAADGWLSWLPDRSQPTAGRSPAFSEFTEPAPRPG